MKKILPLFLGIIATLILCGVSYVGIRHYQLSQNEKIENAKQTKDLTDTQQKALERAQSEIEKLKQESEDAKQKQAKLEQTINTETTPKNLDLSLIIKQWQSKVVYVECKWRGEDGSYILDTFGSGLFTGKNNVYLVFTNKHVVSYEGQAPWICQITFPYLDETYTVNVDTQTMTMKDLAFDPNFDVGELFIKNSSPNLQAISAVNYCNKTANTGDQIVVLGYPGIGSSTGITATEGIISGYDNGYYITSAKVEHGNSGGIAVLIKDNCYLGIPSYVSVGELESLARILDFNYWHNYYSR
ncbi:MAG: trypsin-like peptidase domain-containing protein [Candidatus Buchananbacteria bacterium]